MARAGDVLENPATGDRLTFLQTAAETDGAVLEYELRFRPGGFAVRDHLHPRQSELHHVLEGELWTVVAGAEQRLGPGDEVLVPAGARHRIYATGEEPVLARFELRPALESAVLLETLFGLAKDGKGNARGEPSGLQLAVIFDEFGDLGRPVQPPALVQKAVIGPLAAIGRRRGLRARYPEYSGAS